MKVEIIAVIIGIILFVLGMGVGYLFKDVKSEVVEQCNTQVRIAGLWLPNISKLSNYNGRYICINIDETETFKELYTTCKHEVFHEVWARCGESNNLSYCVNEHVEANRNEGSLE